MRYTIEVEQRTQPSAADERAGRLTHYICWADNTIIDHGFAASDASAKAKAQVAVDAHAAGVLPGWSPKTTWELRPDPQPDPDFDDPGIPEKRQSWKWSGWGKR
jgi:hypothetical protein